MKPVLLGAALLMLAIVSASAAPFSALYAFDDSLSDAATLLSPPAMPSARSTQCLCQRLRGVQQWAGLGAGFAAEHERRRNMNTDRDKCTEERGSLRKGVAALDAKRSRVFAEDDGWRGVSGPEACRR